MFNEFVNWYSNVFIESPIFVLVTTIVALFSTIGSLYNGIVAILALKIKINHKRNLVKVIEKINTDLNIEYINEMLGTPVKHKQLPCAGEAGTVFEYQYTERLYVSKYYYIQIITDIFESMIAYSVTIRDKKFNPKIPIHNGDRLQIGRFTFSELPDKPYKIASKITSKYLYYTETYYFGNPGLYRNFIFGHSPVGVGFTDCFEKIGKLYGTELSIENPLVQNIRENVLPNAFCVFSTQDKLLQQYLTDKIVGIDFYDARELN